MGRVDQPGGSAALLLALLWEHITALTLLVVLILYTIYRVEYPFTGSHIQVTPADFEVALHKMEGE
jgi:hypothetical protein